MKYLDIISLEYEKNNKIFILYYLWQGYLFLTFEFYKS